MKKEIERLERVGWGDGTDAWLVYYVNRQPRRRDYISIQETQEHKLTDELKVYQYVTKVLK